MFQRIRHYFSSIFDTESSGRLVFFSPLVGIVAGLGAVVFFFLLMWFQGLMLGDIVGYFPPAAGSETIEHVPQNPSQWWLVILVPTLGGLVCGMLVYGFAPEAEGHGTDALVKAFHQLSGRIRGRVPFVKTIASIITIGTGGSAGREGPIAQIGAGFGSFLATKLGLSERDRRLLMLAGAAGGIGAIFRAPLGGALFVSEVLYSSTALEFAAVIPCFIASITAYTVFAANLRTRAWLSSTTAGPAIRRGRRDSPLSRLRDPLCTGGLYLRAGLLRACGTVSSKPLPIPNFVKPAVGGLLLGILAVWLSATHVWRLRLDSTGHRRPAHRGTHARALLWQNFRHIVHDFLRGERRCVRSLAVHRRHAGGGLRHGLPAVVPRLDHHPEAFVLVGMGGFFAGVASVPLTAMLMVCEMSGTYGLLVPLMLVSIINVAVLSSRWTFYEEQVPAPDRQPGPPG